MAAASDTRLLVLHGLRLKGFGAPEDIAAIVGLDADEVTKHLDGLQADELAIFREGRLTGWALTAHGRIEQERLLADELETHGCRDTVHGAYTRFLGMNGRLLTICTAWQMKDEATLNPHDDPAYDAGVIDQLGALHDELVPVLVDLESSLERYAGYRPRFDVALGRVRSGDHDWFAKPMIDSYHTVWFQLHEDLLNTLGIERSKEGSA